MLTEIGKIEFTKILLRSFGKHTFSEDELTQNFWTTLYIAAGDFFTAGGNGYNLDFFWSEAIREWLLADKDKWVTEKGIGI